MTRPVKTETIADGTARTWEEWLEFLKSIGAQALTHKEIAKRINETGDASGWWAQTITVTFEQHIGRRSPGQSSGGHYHVSVTKALSGSMDEALSRWLALVAGRSSFDEVPFDGEARTSRTEKWRYWRVSLADGSRVSVQTHEKGRGKAGLAVTHEKLDAPDAVEQWRGYWRGLLAKLDG